MIFLFKFIICFVLVFSCSFPKISCSAPSVSAQGAILIENSTGKVLWEKNAHTKMPMASTTKIMTAICAIENTDPNTLITVDDKAVGIEGSSVYLAKGEKITIEDLLYAMMLNSGNDAATALACAVSGSVENFCILMNKTALKIGAKNTQFKNASGLYEDGHYTTAYDLALISIYAMKNPVFKKIVSEREKTISNGDKPYKRSLRNHNKLLWRYDGCIGVKTGYTKKCGRCLVSSALRDSVMLTAVTLNAPDDWNDHTNLLDYGFSRCVSVPIATEGGYCMTVEVEGSDEKSVGVKFKNSLYAIMIDSGLKNFEIKYKLNPKIKAPLKDGETVGSAHLYIGNTLCSSTDLICAKSVAASVKKGFAENFISSLKTFLSLYKHTEKLYNYRR